MGFESAAGVLFKMNLNMVPINAALKEQIFPYVTIPFPGPGSAAAPVLASDTLSGLDRRAAAPPHRTPAALQTPMLPPNSGWVIVSGTPWTSGILGRVKPILQNQNTWWQSRTLTMRLIEVGDGENVYAYSMITGC